MIRVNKSSKDDLKDLLKSLPERIANVATEVGRAVAEQTQTEVRRRLAGRGGWITIYEQSIIYREDDTGHGWAVSGLNETRPDLFEYPAESSLLFMVGYPENSASSILATYQPWPIDVIPALTSAYPGKAIVQMHDPGTVETYREARLNNLSAVIAALSEFAQVDESGDSLVMVQRVFADIAYMARRLELGFHGYPRVPHWGPAASSLASQGERWASTPNVLRRVESALKGGEPEKVPTMSSSEASELASIRAASWS